MSRRVKTVPFWVENEVHIRAPGMKPDAPLLVEVVEGCTNLIDTVEHVCKQKPGKIAYQVRHVVKQHIERDLQTGKEFITYEHGENKFLTFAQYWEMVVTLAKGLRGFIPESKHLGMYLDTSLDWVMSFHAAGMNRIPLCTMYASMGQKDIIQIVNEAELDVVVINSTKLALFESVKDKVPTLKKLITVGADVKSKVYETMPIQKLLMMGSDEEGGEPFKSPDADDTALIMYTSGTTGNPKGVILTHRGIIAAIAGLSDAVQTPKFEPSKHVYLSYLPLAHIFELAMQHLFLLVGARIGFGNPRTLFAKPGGAKFVGDVENVKPTAFAGVPRVWDTLKKAVEAKVRAAGGVKKVLFDTVMKRKNGYLKGGNNYTVLLEDTVFKKVRAMFGGRLRLLMSGGAALSEESQIFLTNILGENCDVVQGYGLTETSCATSVQFPRIGWQGVGHVGQILPCTEVKLVDVPDMGYFAKDDPPRGEICVKSVSLAKGYYKQKDITDKVFVGEWFHTGDVGLIDKDGNLKIIDRIKNLAKLENGEYVALEHLESLYGTSLFVQPNGICVFAKKSTVCGIVLADQNYLKEWCKNNNVKETDPKKVIKLAAFKKDVLGDFAKIHAKEKLSRADTLKDCRIYVDMWSPEDDTTTPSFKLKRRVIEKKYQNEINKMCGLVVDDELAGEGEEKTAVVTITEAKKEEDKYPKMFTALKSF